MRAREFLTKSLREDKTVTINIPISVRIPSGDGDPEVDIDQKEPPKDPQELDPNPVMVTPLQQELELKKAQAGKISPVIQDLTQDEEDTDDQEFSLFNKLNKGM